MNRLEKLREKLNKEIDKGIPFCKLLELSRLVDMEVAKYYGIEPKENLIQKENDKHEI